MNSDDWYDRIVKNKSDVISNWVSIENSQKVVNN